jgi:hypothetical protein
MTPQDLVAVVRFSEDFHHEHAALRSYPSLRADWLLDFTGKPTNLCLTACRRLPIGYLLAEMRSEEYSGVKFLQVREIYVELGSRLQGCGTKLMREAQLHAQRLQCEYITVKVHNGIPSAGFFNGLGFSTFSTEYRVAT